MVNEQNCICIPPHDWFDDHPSLICTCGEDNVAIESLTCAQHDEGCDIMIVYNTERLSKLTENLLTQLGPERLK